MKNKKLQRSLQPSLFDFQKPSMEKLDVTRCNVKAINHQTASRIVEDYHYAGRTPSIVVAFGLYVDNILLGVITYGIPPQRKVLACCGDEYIDNALELNRLFVFDECGKNTESWFLGQTFKILEKDYSQYFILVSYADNGHGHVGYIYQATNWIYTGISPGVSEKIINGKVFHPKSIFNKYGTRSITELAKKGIEVRSEKQGDKCRYVYFLGSKSQRKKMRRLLKWPVINEYPKKEVIE